MIQRNVDPATSAQHSCNKLNIPELECQRLIDEAKRRWSDAVERPPPAAAPSVHLLVQYYNDKYPPRQEELDACMRFNLANPHVIKIHNLIEPQTVLPAWAANHPKMVHSPPATAIRACVSLITCTDCSCVVWSSNQSHRPSLALFYPSACPLFVSLSPFSL